MELLAFAFLNFIGAMSPGPDFAIVTRYGMTGSRRAAFLATLGISTALLIHVLYCLLGVALFLKSSSRLFTAIQITGSLYLCYLGIQLLLLKRQKTSDVQSLEKRAFLTGFLTNLLNPKATLFLLSLFTQFVTPTTPLPMKLTFGIIIPLTALTWFSLLTYFLTHPKFLPLFQKYQTLFTKAMGVFLVILAGYVMFSVFTL